MGYLKATHGGGIEYKLPRLSSPFFLVSLFERTKKLNFGRDKCDGIKGMYVFVTEIKVRDLKNSYHPKYLISFRLLRYNNS